jgi:hypothetical protein
MYGAVAASRHDACVTVNLARCTMRGCPWRYRGGGDRPCPDHATEPIAALLDLPGELMGTGEPAQANAAPGVTAASTNGHKSGRKAWFE